MPKTVENKNRFSTNIKVLFIAGLILIVVLLGDYTQNYFDSLCRYNIIQKGESMEPHRIPLDIYLAGSLEHPVTVDQEYLQVVVSKANAVWSQYNITFYIRSVNQTHRYDLPDKIVYVRPENSELFNLAESVVGNKLYNNQCKAIDIIVIEDSKWVIRIFPRPSIDKIEARGLLGNKTNFVIYSRQGANQGWNLAHEFGHILNLLDTTTRDAILMSNGIIPCIKNLYPTNLSQNDVDSVVEKARCFD